ncbi:hypothetical protein HNR40_007626 [Nonomuraea endophytica]|uniref:Protein kinase domain-containing protein n=1 Tax=Nonomuraea endophytica TaxID=714136 RepID=A0A7W8ABL5_9ACTN|nr:hypothetical protein [Nonomuraea endophytica]
MIEWEHLAPFHQPDPDLDAADRLEPAHREPHAGGKAVTIYPADDKELEDALETLGRLLKGITGPYARSDGPLFVRHGAFTKLTRVGEEGEPETRDSVGFPFAIESVMSYSNAGGVYLATREGTGERVVLVEARPHAGLDRDGRDAIARLQVQRDILRRLDGLPCVPRLLGHHVAREHHFLVEEHVEGVSLLEEMVRRYPCAHDADGPPEPEVRAYAEWAAEVVGRIGHAMERIHERGVRYGDLHPGNVIVRPGGEIVLVGYEYARDLGDTTMDGGAPGLHAPAGLNGAEADRHQLERVRVWLHLPMNMRPEHTPAQVRRAIGTVTDLFPVDATFTAQTAAGIDLTGDGPPPTLPTGCPPTERPRGPLPAAARPRGPGRRLTPLVVARAAPGDDGLRGRRLRRFEVGRRGTTSEHYGDAEQKCGKTALHLMSSRTGYLRWSAFSSQCWAPRLRKAVMARSRWSSASSPPRRASAR